MTKNDKKILAERNEILDLLKPLGKDIELYGWNSSDSFTIVLNSVQYHFSKIHVKALRLLKESLKR